MVRPSAGVRRVKSSPRSAASREHAARTEASGKCIASHPAPIIRLEAERNWRRSGPSGPSGCCVVMGYSLR